ncbi:MAG: hypothetical protein Crog4KO_25970 [Crocinitomicaceae bacterium]
MIGYLIHTELVKKRNGKLQLQIKLPNTIEKITGVLAVIDTKNTFRIVPPDDGYQRFKGSLWLRIPEKRDVFYAADVIEYHGQVSSLFRKPQFGFIHSRSSWISGRIPELFSVNVPVETTVIEGYYEDESNDQMNGYTLKIYLQTQL